MDKRTGTPANDGTPSEFIENRVIPGVHSILHWVNKKNPLGPKPADPTTDPQYLRWEIPIQKWVGSNPSNLNVQVPVTIPTVVQPNATTVINKGFKVTITSPNQLTRYVPSSKIDITLTTDSAYPIVRVEFYINGQYINTLSREPFSISFVAKELPLPQKYNNIRAVVYNSQGEKAETVAAFVVNY